jgi:hypothetical protein
MLQGETLGEVRRREERFCRRDAVGGETLSKGCHWR